MSQVPDSVKEEHLQEFLDELKYWEIDLAGQESTGLSSTSSPTVGVQKGVTHENVLTNSREASSIENEFADVQSTSHVSRAPVHPFKPSETKAISSFQRKRETKHDSKVDKRMSSITVTSGADLKSSSISGKKDLKMIDLGR